MSKSTTLYALNICRILYGNSISIKLLYMKYRKIYINTHGCNDNILRSWFLENNLKGQPYGNDFERKLLYFPSLPNLLSHWLQSNKSKMK